MARTLVHRPLKHCGVVVDEASCPRFREAAVDAADGLASRRGLIVRQRRTYNLVKQNLGDELGAPSIRVTARSKHQVRWLDQWRGRRGAGPLPERPPGASSRGDFGIAARPGGNIGG